VRSLALIRLLLEQAWTRDQLAAQLKVTTRTISRDLSALLRAGVSVKRSAPEGERPRYVARWAPW
jgi:predicted DNA-binding transcriptional regulator YafY